MAEKSLGDPLADFEIKRMILDNIEKRLNGDCTLAGGLAYAGFSYQFELKIQYMRSLTRETLVWGVGASTQQPIKAEEIESSVVINEVYKSPAPDVARQEFNLPVPVIVQTPTGPQRRRVHIEKAK